MIIDCPSCESKVDAKLLAEKEDDQSEYSDPSKTVFLECPLCHGCLVGSQDMVQVDYDEYDWSAVRRLWPQPAVVLDFGIPKITRKSLEEAKKCLTVHAYSASAVMCGRAIEGICAEHKTKSKNLAGGLTELRDSHIIDQRLYEWGNSLREMRNIGAHATDEDVSREDARDLFEFAVAISEYVFVLSAKYEEFKSRQKAKSPASTVVKKAASAKTVAKAMPATSATTT
jgi:hypothetical protein